jgi:hypothetical protein
MRLILATLLLLSLSGCVEQPPAAPQVEEDELELLLLELELLRAQAQPRYIPVPTPSPTPNCPGPFCKIVEADLPLEQRYENWGSGSCYYASTCSPLMNIANGEHFANWIHEHRAGGASIGDIRRTLDHLDVDYVYTANGDWNVLEYANRNNLMAAIEFKSSHACTFMGMDAPYVWNGAAWVPHPDRHVWVLDNNHISRPEKYSLAAFQREWYRQGGRAIVPLGLPMPPTF